MNTKRRKYNNIRRAEEAGNTQLKIMKAAGRLWTQYSLNDITLEMIAKESEVTTRTVLRKFGSKENVFEECLSDDAANPTVERNESKVGDIDDILKTLLANYESMGDAAIRTIYLEPEMEIARKVGKEGRKVHKDWCIRMFAPYLPNPDSQQYELDLAAFIASTEIYLWKLLRKDLKMSKKQTLAVFKKMVQGLISTSH